MSADRCYFDHQAWTPLDDRVRKGLEALQCASLAHPDSGHAEGRRAARALRDAEKRLLRLLVPQSPTWLSSGAVYWGTSASQLIQLLHRAWHTECPGAHSACASYSHPSVLAAAGQVLPPGAEFAAEPRGRCLWTASLANSELGFLESELPQLGEGDLLHLDACQGFGLVPWPSYPVHCVTLAGHKLYGPSATAALLVDWAAFEAKGYSRARFESHLRVPGMAPVEQAHALSLAAELAQAEGPQDAAHLRGLCQAIWSGLRAHFGEALRLHGPEIGPLRHPGNLNIGLQGPAHAGLVACLDQRGFALSSASACQGDAGSHVLRALGIAVEGWGVLRISPGRRTCLADCDRLVEAIVEVARGAT